MSWFQATLARLARGGERDVRELSMGPVTLDVETARRVGWSDETIVRGLRASHPAAPRLRRLHGRHEGRVIDPLSVACPHCLSLAGEPCVLDHIGAGQPHHTPHEAREERARAVVQAAREERARAVVQAATTEPPPPSVPPEYEAIARALEEHAAALRDLGRYGPRALGEGEDPVDALWDLATTLEGKAREVDSLAHALEVEISARLLAREGTA